MLIDTIGVSTENVKNSTLKNFVEKYIILKQ